MTSPPNGVITNSVAHKIGQPPRLNLARFASSCWIVTFVSRIEDSKVIEPIGSAYLLVRPCVWLMHDKDSLCSWRFQLMIIVAIPETYATSMHIDLAGLLSAIFLVVH